MGARRRWLAAVVSTLVAVGMASPSAAAGSRTTEVIYGDGHRPAPGLRATTTFAGQAAADAAADNVTVSASQTKTGLAIMSPWSIRSTNEPLMTDAQRVAFEDRMVADIAEAQVKLVRMEIASTGEGAVDLALYRRLVDKLPADTKVIAVLNHALVEGGVTGSGLPANDSYLYQLQDSVVVAQYPEYGATTKFMKVWLDKALAVVTAFAPRLAAVEVLNEANKLYHPGTPYHTGPYVIPADAYGRLISKFYRYCVLAGSKPCGSTLKVITHGMHPAMDGGEDQLPDKTANDDHNFLRAFLRSPSVAAFKAANGGAHPFHGIGYHPYPFAMGLNLPGGYANAPTATVLAGINGRLDALKAVLTAEGVAAARSSFWLTETGFNSNDVTGTLDQKETKQGLYIKDVFGPLSARADVAQTIWYRYHEGNVGAPAENWGLVSHKDRFYGNLPPRYKRTFCDFVWQRGISSTAHCPKPKQVAWRTYFNDVLYPVSYWEFPQYVVEAGGVQYTGWQVEQQLGAASKLLSGSCSPYDEYGCSTADYSRFPVPSKFESSNRFRVRFSDYTGQGPWSDWMNFTPMVGTTAAVYGPPSGATLNFKTEYVSFPVAVPVQWLRNNPGGQPFLRFHQALPGGGWVRLVQLPTMPSLTSDWAQTSNHVLYVFSVSITASSTRTFVAGPIEFRFGIGQAGCGVLCSPINAAESFTFSFNHA